MCWYLCQTAAHRNPLRAADYRTKPLGAAQVSTPVTWGFTFANLRLSSQLSTFTLPYCRRASDAAAPQMLPLCSFRWDELPNCTDTPIVRLAASSTACNGVVAAPVCPNVSTVAIPSRTIDELVIAMLSSKGLQLLRPHSSPALRLDPSLFIHASNEAGATNVRLFCFCNTEATSLWLEVNS